ncbi:MAG: exodeoxyribonuclease VII large subunit [Pseudohongiella nitratireducens]|nr:exodeoxyribonuclease VII large subunit [Pseudohongiella nitratireducens]MDF1621884.1 exodeoxyribonuclease VII large subunit [Pseudohongiella nitratireducens]
MKSSYQPVGPTDENIISVSTLNRLARGLLEECFPSVIVEGEISNLAMPASGHWYLTLKDEHAQIRCAMFRNRNRSVRLKPGNGMQVIVRGRLSLYEGRGDYQLILDSLEDAGAGALQRAFDALKKKLAEEGLFDAERKRPVDDSCRHVAVITSPTGAVIRDIISVFRRRYPGMNVTVLPVAVQGEAAVPAIIQAIHAANLHAEKLGFDAILLARGGGSLEDLQAFNDEGVARAIVASALPVVSAVGHETDVSIADFVADLRAPTPSAAAELLSPDQAEWMAGLAFQAERIGKLLQQTLQRKQQQLAWTRKRLVHPGRRLQDQAQQLDRLEQQLQRALRVRLQSHSQRVSSLRQRLQHPGHKIRQQSAHLKQVQARLQRAMKQQLQAHQQSLGALARQLDSISPLQTIQRGYSVTKNTSSAVITSVSQVQTGEEINTVVTDGVIRSIVSSASRGGQYE